MTANLKKEISSVELEENESFYDYWERFKKLCASCPYHGYSDLDLILYFYEGLTYEDRKMVNGACGGNLVTKTVDQAKSIFKELAEGARTKGRKSATRKLHAIGSGTSELEQKVDGLTEMIKSIVVNTSMPSIMKKVC